MEEIFFASMVLGLFSGILSGLFGIGGGIIIVPALALLFQAQKISENLVMIMAIATSLASIIFTSMASVVAHHRLGSVSWYKVFTLAPGIFLGSAGGAFIANVISADVLRLIFIGFLFYVGTQMALGKSTRLGSGTADYSKIIDFWVGCLIGVLSALVGIGGGTLTVPYLVHSGYQMRNAVAISSACGLPIAVASTVSYVVLGQNSMSLPAMNIGYVNLPAVIGVSLTSVITAPLGAKLAHRMPAKQLKRYFAIVIYLMAIKMIWQH